MDKSMRSVSLFTAVFFVAGLVGMMLAPELRAALILLGVIALVALFLDDLSALAQDPNAKADGNADAAGPNAMVPRHHRHGQGWLDDGHAGWHVRFVVVAIIIVSLMLLLGSP